ncbi:MAG: hypothetical protein IJL17_13395 [Kiritimatiellae bacterium]|nr:hypothetical protein [Kiritimatiellia bacterium]
MKKTFLVITMACGAVAAHAAVYTFTNANGDDDLATPANWGLETWSASDSGTLSSASVMPNLTKISTDWAVDSLYYNSSQKTAKTCTLDLCGNTLNANTLKIAHAASGNRCLLVVTNGRVVVSGKLTTTVNTASMGFIFRDGADVSIGGISLAAASGNTSPHSVEVGKGASLTFTGNGYILGSAGDCRPNSTFTVNGGTVYATGMSGLMSSGSNGKTPHFNVVNGGRFFGDESETFLVHANSGPATVAVTNGAVATFGKGLKIENVSKHEIVFRDSVVTGAVTFATSLNTLTVMGGVHVGTLSFGDATRSNAVTVADCTSSGGVSFGSKGVGHTVVLSGGSRTASGDNAISFGANTTNATLVIDNMTFTFNGQFNKDQSSNGSPYSTCPGSAIEFRGAAPRLYVTGSGKTYADWISGTMTDADVAAPVRLRYVLPATPYASAPLYHSNSSFPTGHFMQLGFNTVFEFDLTDLVRTRGTRKIPIVYSGNGTATNGNRLGGKLNLDGLTRRMVVKGAYWSDDPSLELSGDNKTLYLVIKGMARGTNVIFR